MSRFDVSKFSPVPDQELICGICMHILDMPKESPCRHVFCKVCIGQALKEKSNCPICRTPFKESHLKDVLPLVQNMLNKLTMCCDNYDNGCKELIPMERFLPHVQNCNYVIVICKYRSCGKSLLKLNIEHHESNECLFRDIACTKGCGLAIPWKDRESHKCIEALLTYKNELTTQNKLLEMKIEELKSALKNKTEECESKNSKNKQEKTNADQEMVLSPTLESDSDDDVGSHIPSLSSISSPHFVDSDEYSFTDVGQSDMIQGVEIFPHDPVNQESTEIETPEYQYGHETDENQERERDWTDSEIQAYSPSSVHYESVDEEVYHYEQSGGEEPHERSHMSDGSEHSAGASYIQPLTEGLEEVGDDVGRTSSNKRRRECAPENSQSKRSRADFDNNSNEDENDTMLRRSRRLRNQEPHPAYEEIPCVDVPPSFSLLLDRYANEDSSSDDESWSPSHFL